MLIDEEHMRFRMHYRCEGCDLEWEMVWSADCDDRCPSCNTPHSPHTTEDWEDM